MDSGICRWITEQDAIVGSGVSLNWRIGIRIPFLSSRHSQIIQSNTRMRHWNNAFSIHQNVHVLPIQNVKSKLSVIPVIQYRDGTWITLFTDFMEDVSRFA